MERLTDEIAVIEPGTYLVSDDLLDDVPEIRNVSKKELYYRLGLIENVLGKNYDLDHLRELIEADREGRVKILPESTENTCGTCENFLRIEGTKRGHCKLKPLVNSQYGMRYNIPFEPSQSRKACKNYEPALKAMKESNNEKDN